MRILPISEDHVEEKADETKHKPSWGQCVVDCDYSPWLHSVHFYVESCWLVLNLDRYEYTNT